MWGNPREGTEAHKVKLAVEKKKQEAKSKKLDDLFSSVYHDSVDDFPAYIKDERNKEYVHPAITNAIEGKEGEKRFVEFVMDKKCYKITEKYGGYIDEPYYNYDLFVDGRKVFGVSESHISDEWTTNYEVFSINSFVNEDWVADFKEIKEHYNQVSKKREIEWAEDPTKTQGLRDDFGIEENYEDFVPESAEKESIAYPVQNERKPFWKSVWFWIILIAVLFDLLG